MQRIRKAVFPVAGLGTRFLPATKAMPKEMLPVVDRPLIQHVVDEAREAGIEHFIFARLSPDDQSRSQGSITPGGAVVVSRSVVSGLAKNKNRALPLFSA